MHILITDKHVPVENSRLIDKIKNDAWNISMIAEYENKIFKYIKDLEVGINILRMIILLTRYRSRYSPILII